MKTDKEKIDAFVEALGNSIAEASDEEILGDLREAGLDPDAEACRLKSMMLDTVKKFQKGGRGQLDAVPLAKGA